MLPPTLQINTFIKDNEKLDVDPISKIFVVLQVMFGLDRMPLIGKGQFIYVFLTFIISAFFYGAVIYVIVLGNIINPVNVMLIATIIRNIINTLLSFTRCKWLKRYYSKLNEFDIEIGYKPKVSKCCIWNMLQAGIMCIFLILIHSLVQIYGTVWNQRLYLLPIHIIYVIEVYYFGHLLNLLALRLKLINYLIEFSLSSATSGPSSLHNEFVYLKSHSAYTGQCETLKLLNLYQVVVEAYDFLIEGIKWELLVVIISGFITVLGFLYAYIFKFMRTGEALTEISIMKLGVTVVIMIPLFAPCTSSDRVHNEVTKLRELLASRLYENKLDKSGRSVARTLLAFTETRDLSFRLLRMLNVDITLPFKFVGLLVTYLIILLQFEKVINP